MFTHTSLYSANTQMFSEYYGISGIVLFTERVTRNYVTVPLRSKTVIQKFSTGYQIDSVKRFTNIGSNDPGSNEQGSNDIVSYDKRSKKYILCII